MASKVYVTIPAVVFGSGGNSTQGTTKKGAELVAAALGCTDNGMPTFLLPSLSGDPLLRISQLEQNIKYLYEQHQIMLSSLHQEIESLSQKNSDLQYQLIFNRKINRGSDVNSESSVNEENVDDTDMIAQSLSSTSINDCSEPVSTHKTKVQILESEISALKFELKDNKKDLQDVLLDQTSHNDEVEKKLEEANLLIKKLRQINEDQKREIVTLRYYKNRTTNNESEPTSSDSKASEPKGPRSGGSGSNRGRQRERESNQNGKHQRFPPLNGQYWQKQRRSDNNYNPGSNVRALPELSERQNIKPVNHNGYSRYYNNLNYYNNNYRGHRAGGGGNSNTYKRQQQKGHEERRQEKPQPDAKPE